MDGTQVEGKTVAEHIVDFLERREVKHVFGLCGHTNISVLAALAESPIDFVTVRHEQIASHAADAYARVTGKASVVLSHLSPGLTNCATGVANAALDCIPMVVIAGDIPTHYYGKHPHQEVNLHADAQQYEIYRPFVKRAWRVDRADLMAEILEKAFHLAESGQPGPVLVNVPMDIFSEVIPSDSFDRIIDNTRALVKPSIDDETARQIVERLAKAEKPVAYVGGGILLAKASEELREFVEHIIDFLEIQSIRRTPVGRLPYGLQKRVELGRALAMEPTRPSIPSWRAGLAVTIPRAAAGATPP